MSAEDDGRKLEAGVVHCHIRWTMTSRPSPARADSGQGIVKAVLGPTNTGKTHLAIERMIAHSSGAIGFPLRLLAREVYDKVRAIKGDARVALITGEEIGRAHV